MAPAGPRVAHTDAGRSGRTCHFEPRISLPGVGQAASAKVNRRAPAAAVATPAALGADGTGSRASARGSRPPPRRPIAAPAGPGSAARHDGQPAGRWATAARCLRLRHGLVRPRNGRTQALDGRGRPRRPGSAVGRRAPGPVDRLVNDFLNGLAGNGLGRRRQRFDPRGTRGGGLQLGWDAFSAAVTRPNSVTTARQTNQQRRPPTTAKAPAKISVAPRFNSFIGIPKPINAPRRRQPAVYPALAG